MERIINISNAAQLSQECEYTIEATQGTLGITRDAAITELLMLGATDLASVWSGELCNAENFLGTLYPIARAYFHSVAQ